MNKIDYNQAGGFPLSTQILDAGQTAYSIFNAHGAMAGNFAIIDGCEVGGGGFVTDGYVRINGELLELKGGQIATNVTIVEEPDLRGFEDGSQKAVIYKRYATFGGGNPSYPWASFRRPLNLFQLEDRLLKVEKATPIGLVAIWDRPADEIPEGWVEHTDMAGTVPVGHQNGDLIFGALGSTVGAKEIQLTSGHLPKLDGQFPTLANNAGSGIVSKIGGSSSSVGGSSSPSFQHSEMKISFGNNEKHSNIQPSRIVKFIRFVGFSE
ncbi:hypothetical protein [Epilithonimonas hispanica]|uniref:Microcystin-dependent protein n=1 Tax=Epilithonimonas hispanica TaxID=358687 RepID=A0A3D9D0E8_9FLAO|nr:hypothetical protein [Epilithonimonas hispanica]REC71387.1 hypothetical protein DRF58_06105 [Epilithonimonas hispanica]